MIGYAKHMRDALPGASFIGFTATPIRKADANTQETFGGYVSIYGIVDAKEDSKRCVQCRLERMVEV